MKKATSDPWGLPRVRSAQPVRVGLEVPWGTRQSGIHWDADHRYAWALDPIPPEWTPWLAPPWSWAWWQAARANGYWPAVPAMAPIWRPRPHQEVAAAAIAAAFRAGAPGFALADDMGVGKTLAVLAWLQRHPEMQRIIIAAPLSSLAHWRASLCHLGLLDRRLILLNHDRMERLMTSPPQISSRAKGRRRRVARKGQPMPCDVFILDEAHRAANPESAIGVLARRLSAAARFTVWLSGTLGTRPMEMAYLAPLLGWRTGHHMTVDTLSDFGRWCMDNELGIRRAAFGAWTMDTTPKVQLAAARRMHDLLFLPSAGHPPIALRRRPQEIANWPALEVGLWSQDAPEPPTPGRVPAARRLAAATAWRQQDSLARIEATAMLAMDHHDQGRAVAISVAFLETLDRLAATLRERGCTVVAIDGRQSPAEREHARRVFQSARADVMLFTVVESISLHQGEQVMDTRPRTLLIHDIRWRAIEQAQIEGRVHRDGQSATILWCHGEHARGRRIAQVVLEARQRMVGLHGDDPGLVDRLLSIIGMKGNP